MGTCWHFARPPHEDGEHVVPGFCVEYESPPFLYQCCHRWFFHLEEHDEGGFYFVTATEISGTPRAEIWRDIDAYCRQLERTILRESDDLAEYEKRDLLLHRAAHEDDFREAATVLGWQERVFPLQRGMKFSG